MQSLDPCHGAPLLATQGVNGDAWKKLAKACFPKEYASTREGDKEVAKARAKELLATPKDKLLEVGKQ